ncbi:CHASE domain-containing protein [Ideonella paludis]|uniref:CHASE domain-containing protein n=1 Tax=Ideonella paludis TaxID=1233411 RepID=UPI003625D88B
MIGTPRSLWASRRLTVGLPLIAVTTVLVIATLLMARGDEERRLDQFNRDASQLANAVEVGLHEPLHALDALRGLFMVADNVTSAKMETATQAWLSMHNGLHAMGFAQRVSRAQIPAFEAAARADGLPDFKFFERPDGLAETQNESEVLAIRHIQPLSTNAAALGVNSLSAPAARGPSFKPWPPMHPPPAQAFA